MSFNLYNYHSAAWVDISDYLVSASEIPFTSRNGDWTLRGETWNIEIAGSIQDELPAGYSLGKGNQVKITKDAGFLISGYIEQSNFNYERQIYEIVVNSPLLKLKDKMVGYDNLHAPFATGSASQYWVDYLTYNSVQVLWALEKVFALCGLTLTVPAPLKATTLFTRTASTGAWAGRAITYADLYFDEYQLYCLGMQSAAQPVSVISDPFIRYDSFYTHLQNLNITLKVNNDPEVNCFDFVSEIFTSLKLTVQETDTYAYTLIAPTTNFTIADDDNYNYSTYEILARSTDLGYSWVTYNASGNWSITSSNRDKYYSATETNPPDNVTENKDKISIMQNFRILFADTATVSSEYNESVCSPDLSGSLIIDDESTTGHLNPFACRYANQAGDFTVQEITTAATDTFKTVAENFIDLENRTSRIIQETYA